MNKKICIVGTGGFGREVLCLVKDIHCAAKQSLSDVACFMVDDAFYKEEEVMGVEVIRRSQFQPRDYQVVVAIGDPVSRKKVVDMLPVDTNFATLVHPTAVVSDYVEIGEGSIITAGCILTCNIRMGQHAHLNLLTTVGHDCTMGDYFTTAPGVNISGNCTFGNYVYIGTNAAIRQGVAICNDVTVGMGGIVLKNINEPGIYIGNPVKKMIRDAT